MILVTGMMRSGTSLVCQVLTKLGQSFGDPGAMIPADRWNAGGYFEVREVMDVNSRIVTGISRTASPVRAWAAKVAYVAMPSVRSMPRRAARHRATIEDIGRRYRGAVLKDPRFCLTLRFWREWTEVDRIVVCVRHPASVLHSLARRHSLPKWLSARFYAWHVNTLVDQLPSSSVVFLDVDRLVDGAADELEALGRGLGANVPAPSSLLDDVVDPDAFTRVDPDAAGCPEVAVAAWQRLRALAAASRTQPAGGAS